MEPENSATCFVLTDARQTESSGSMAKVRKVRPRVPSFLACTAVMRFALGSVASKLCC